MNQRMIDLYKEASEFAYKVCREEGRTGGPGDHIWNTLSTGRFAELIVRECAKIAEEQGETAEHSFTETRAKWFRNGAIKSATMIKRTFGVEE